MRPLDIRSYKNELRAHSKARRNLLDPLEKVQRDDAIAENVKRLYQYRTAKTILLYMSTKIEVSTEKLIEAAWQDGKSVAVPRCVPNTRNIQFYYINSFDQLHVGAFSVREPSEKLPVLRKFDSSLLIVPALMVDSRGYRLGYGKGYYDRFMSNFKGQTVALCYTNDFLQQMYHGRFDRTVDVVVTERWIKSIKK